MKKKPSLVHYRSSYNISPLPRPVKSPTPRVSPLPSPFPPHVHRFLFSGRQITLMDQRGILISKVAEASEDTKSQLDRIQSRLDKKERSEKRTKTMSQVDNSPPPYHLNEEICASLNQYADQHVEKFGPDTISSHESEFDEELGPLPQASPQLLQLLNSESQRKQSTNARKRVLHSISVEPFSQPRRGSHPGISPSPSPLLGHRSVRNSPSPQALHHKTNSIGDLQRTRHSSAARKLIRVKRK